MNSANYLESPVPIYLQCFCSILLFSQFLSTSEIMSLSLFYWLSSPEEHSSWRTGPPPSTLFTWGLTEEFLNDYLNASCAQFPLGRDVTVYFLNWYPRIGHLGTNWNHSPVTFSPWLTPTINPSSCFTINPVPHPASRTVRIPQGGTSYLQLLLEEWRVWTTHPVPQLLWLPPEGWVDGGYWGVLGPH